MKLNLADKITLSRVAVVPVLVALLYAPSRMTCLAAMLLFIAACLTDLLDGVVARKYNLVSTFGKFLDPLADKILISSVLVMLAYLRDADNQPWVQPWIVIVILGRELLVTGLRAMAVEHGQVIAADRYGKLKTVLQIVAMCPLIFHYPLFGFDVRPAGQIMLYIALAMTVFSGGNYLASFFRASLHPAASGPSESAGVSSTAGANPEPPSGSRD